MVGLVPLDWLRGRRWARFQKCRSHWRCVAKLCSGQFSCYLFTQLNLQPTPVLPVSRFPHHHRPQPRLLPRLPDPVSRPLYPDHQTTYRVFNMESLNEEQTPFAAVTAQTSKIQRVRLIAAKLRAEPYPGKEALDMANLFAHSNTKRILTSRLPLSRTDGSEPQSPS